MIRSGKLSLSRMTVLVRYLGVACYLFAYLQLSTAIRHQKEERSRTGIDGSAFGHQDPPEDCAPMYGELDREEDCHLAIDQMPFGRDDPLESLASFENTEFLDRNAIRRYPFLPYVILPRTWTVGNCAVTLMMQQPSDNAAWVNVLANARHLVEECVVQQGFGGSQLTGENNNVGVYVYGVNSNIQEYLEAISMFGLVYEPHSECSDAGTCPEDGVHQQTPCSTGYSIAPTDCCSSYHFSWRSIPPAIVRILLGTRQFFPNDIYGWCSLYAEVSPRSRARGIWTDSADTNRAVAGSTVISELDSESLQYQESDPMPGRDILRRTTVDRAQFSERYETHIKSREIEKSKRSRLAQPGDRGPSDGRFGTPESPPQCGQVYGHPEPGDCLQAFNRLFPNFPQSFNTPAMLRVRRFAKYSADPVDIGVGGVVLPDGGLRGTFGNCALTLQLRDDPDPPVHPTSESAAWYDIITSFIDVISDCAEGQGLGGRQDTGQNNLLTVRVYGPSTAEYEDLTEFCESVIRAARGSLCSNANPLADIAIPSGAQNNRPVSPYSGRSCSTGYATLASDCCEAFVFVVERTTTALSRLIWGTLGAAVQHGYCTFVLDTLGS